MFNTLDTIAAVATPSGESALAVVRLSGPASAEIAGRLLSAGRPKERYATYTTLGDGNGRIIDTVVAIYYRAPASYTGEDMLEIICHGGRIVPEQILKAACANGARPARPGEFTLRAFLNGKLDLTRAEAVDTIIRARTERSGRIAADNLSGKLQEKLQKIETRLVELLTVLEAQIDFAEDEITKLSKSSLEDSLAAIAADLSQLTKNYDFGRLAAGEIQVAIIGDTNVGKSTLFNALLKAERAITSPDPGTTRDYIADYLNLAGFPVKLIDTAGIREGAQAVEEEGIRRTRELIESSDILLMAVEAGRKLSQTEQRTLESIHNRKHILVVTKIDLVPEGETPESLTGLNDNFVKVSAKYGWGISGLIDRLSDMVGADCRDESGILLSQRQFLCAERAMEHIEKAAISLKSGEPEEVLAMELREALDCLGELLGKVTNEDILNSIFARFCIGK